MNRKYLFSSTALIPTAAERRMGRFMRAPDGHGDGEGGNDSSTSGDNGNGNSGDSNNGDGDGNNSGQADPLAGFWEDKPPENDGNDDSVAEEGKAIGAQLAGLIDGAAFDPVFNQDVAAKIAEGDFQGVNDAIQAGHRATMKQSVVVFAKLIEAFGARQNTMFESRLQAALGNEKNNEALEVAFPAAKDPAVRPMIQRVFDQALKNSNGDRGKATAMTKDMLKAFGTKTGLTTPPADPSGSSSASTSLVDSLLGRDDN